MMKRLGFLSYVLLGTAACSDVASPQQPAVPSTFITHNDTIEMEKIQKSNEDWEKELDPETFRVMRKQGTERAFTGAYWDHHEQGVYRCASCDLPLFHSSTKFDSGTGWPSYFQPIHSNSVEEQRDTTFGMIRREVHCTRCGGHLGHVFEDGPRPTGLRYCINSISLKFEKTE